MRYRSLAALSLAAGLVLAGCGDDEESRTPAEPQFNHTASASCDFNFNSLISQFFVQPRLGVVLGLKQQMEAAHQASSETNVQKYGFDILANIEAAVNLGQSTNATVGSQLANRLLACMFTEAQIAQGTDPTLALPIDFSQELTVNGGTGAFGVRGGSTQYDTAGPVFSHDRWSGVTPANSAAWSTVLSTRTLLYGERGTDLASFDWHKVLRSTTFAFPYVLVGICVPAGDDQMLVENGSAVLAFDGTHFGLSCQTSAMRRSSDPATGWGLFDLARRVVEFITPNSLHAAVMFSNTTTGKTGSFSNFRSDAIATAASEYLTAPPATVQVNVVVTPTITVKVTALDDETDELKPAVNQLVRLVVASSISNQGTNVEVGGATAITNGDGIASFPDFVIKKAGTYTIQAFFELGRPGVGVTYDQVGGIQAGGTGKKKP
jgi:hypothetical protein